MTHLSSLALDALALGGHDPAADEHLADCLACRAERAAIAELHAEFARRVLPRGVPGRRSFAWAWLAVPALAAALFAVLAWPRGEPEPDLGIKGDASWQVFANHAGQTFAVHDGTRLGAGDRIRFVVEPAGARYLLVASVDGLGHATIYYPYAAPMSTPIAGERIELDGSIELDAAPGPERVFAIFSDVPLSASVVANELRAVALGGPDAIRSTHALHLAGHMQSVVFEKAAP